MRRLRLTFLVVVLMVATVASAQFSWGVQGGLNLSSLRYEGGVSSDIRPGLNIGVLADYSFAPNMSIRSGLHFTLKGSLQHIVGGKSPSFLNLPYLQIPIHFAYRINVVPRTRFVFHAGPYIAANPFNSSRVQYNPFDFGVGLGVGTESGRFLTGIGWDMGLIDISNFEHGSARNRNVSLTVGYRF